MHNLTVLPSYKVLDVEDGHNLRTALSEGGFAVKSPCGGSASCGQCSVVIKSFTENSLNDVTFEEKQLLGNVFHITSERLSCQTKIFGDMTVDVSSHIEVVKKTSKVVRRSGEEAQEIVEQRREKSKSRPHKQGGFKRPKSFTSDEEDKG